MKNNIVKIKFVDGVFYFKVDKLSQFDNFGYKCGLVGKFIPNWCAVNKKILDLGEVSAWTKNKTLNYKCIILNEEEHERYKKINKTLMGFMEV